MPLGGRTGLVALGEGRRLCVADEDWVDLLREIKASSGGILVPLVAFIGK
jgi:hypothetical protein